MNQFVLISSGATGTSTSTRILVVIINDDEPEIDETFEVQLVSVAETGQRIDSEQVNKIISIRNLKSHYCR